MKGFKGSTRLAGSFSNDALGRRIYALRVHSGLSRKDFASRSGLSESQVGRLERGGSSTRGDNPTIDGIARAFGVQPVWLFSGSIAPQCMWPEWWNPNESAAA